MQSAHVHSTHCLPDYVPVISTDAGTATPPMYTPPASRAAALVGDGLSFLGGMLASEDSPTRLARRSFPGVIPSASTAPTATIAQKQRAQQQTHSYVVMLPFCW